MRRRVGMLSVIITTMALMVGCSFMIEGQDIGRPCDDGRCPHGYECIDGHCWLQEDPPVSTECTASEDCECEGLGVPACGEDRVCRCVVLEGRLDGVGADMGVREGRFDLVGSRVGSADCGSESDSAYMLCGGITQ